jgi:sister-chromatid-cohesion protein PDS5
LFFLAHDPDKTIKSSTMTWIRARRAAFAARKETVLESVFARLLSLLAHHPDFDTEEDTLKLMSEYILYYLKCVATEENLSLIFHVAQRVKGVADGIAPTRKADENLYVLSDLAQALIRSWEEQNNWTMQSWPGKMKLPSGIFRPLESHDRAQEIAKKTWIGEELVDELDPLVRKAIRSKKRKASDDVEKPRKKTKGDRPIKEKKAKTERPAKTPKKKRRGGDDDDESEREGGVAPSSEPRRKSDRRSTVHKSYVEVSSDEEEVGAGAEEVQEEEADDSDAEEAEEADKSTPAPEAEEEEEDAEMADAEPPAEEQPEAAGEHSELSDPEPSSEPEPEAAPVKKTARGKAATKTNGVKSSPAVQKRKAVEPVKEATPPKSAKSTAKGKAKPNGAAAAAASSSPAINGTGSVRRSGRTRG